jgi:hypothetical protein
VSGRNRVRKKYVSREGCEGPSGQAPEFIFRFVFFALFARKSSRQTPRSK